MANLILVHGGMIGGNCWNKIKQSLEKEGRHRVFSPSLTGLGERKHLSHPAINLDTHIADILNLIFYEELEDIILIGHSYGGMVITGVAGRIPKKIKKLIYLAAVLPKEEESMFDAVGPEISSFLYESAKRGNGWQVPPSPPESYGIDDPKEIKWFKKMVMPHPLKSFEQKLDIKSGLLQEIERVYIHCSQDVALESMVERAKKMKIPCHEIQSGHFPMLTARNELVDLLLEESTMSLK